MMAFWLERLVGLGEGVKSRLRGWLEEVEQHGEPELQAFALRPWPRLVQPRAT